MDDTYRLIIAGALTLLMLFLAGCGIDGAPVPPQPNEWPEPGTALDWSQDTGVNLDGSSDELYGLSI